MSIFSDIAEGAEKAAKVVKRSGKPTYSEQARKNQVAGPAIPKKLLRKKTLANSKASGKANVLKKKSSYPRAHSVTDEGRKQIIKNAPKSTLEDLVDEATDELIKLLPKDRRHMVSGVPLPTQEEAKDFKGVEKNVVRTGKNIVETTADNPDDVLLNTLKSVPETLASTLVFPVNAVKEAVNKGPAQAGEDIVKGVVKDYKTRYGQSTPAQKKRFKEQGILPELLDASMVAGAGGAGVGRLLTAGARRGVLGSKALNVVSGPRPKLRLSAGVAKEQDLSKNFFKAAGQRKLDKARSKKTIKAVRENAAGQKKIDPIRKDVPGDQVVPLRSKTVKKFQRRDTAAIRGRAHQSRQTEVADSQRDFEKGTAALSGLEQKALKPMIQFGIRDAETARKVLPKRVASIKSEQVARGIDTGKFSREKNNDLAVLEELLQSPEKAFTVRAGKVADRGRRMAKKAGSGDPGFTSKEGLARTYVQQADILGMPDPGLAVTPNVAKSIRRAAQKGKVKNVETSLKEASVKTPDFDVADAVSLIRKKAKEEGLADPGYFKSSRFEENNFGNYTTGGSQAIQGAKKYTGAAHKVGMEDTRPQVLSDAVALNIKRKHNWKAVADTVDRHTFEWGRNKSLGELRELIEQQGLDDAKVRVWMPKKFRDANETHSHSTAKGRDIDDSGEEFTESDLARAVDDAAVDWKTLREKADSPEYKNAKFSLVPTEVFDELKATTRPSGAGGRSVDIAKQKAARVMLGTSPAWALAQPVANAVTAGLTGVGPVTFVKAQRFWKKFSKAEQDAISPYLGVSAFRQETQLTKLGAAADSHMVNAYRAFKQTALYKYRGTRVGQRVGNPLDALFRFDNTQNNAFRKAVLYKAAKRDAYARMGKNARGIIDVQRKLLDGDIRKALKDEANIERHAKYVNDFLGDFVTYTARERRFLQRYVMFYGFLRFSLKFTFHTMPAQHPILSSIIAQLGHLQAGETKEILGKQGEILPAWAAGKLFLSKDESINVGRINPALNALVSASEPSQLVGLQSPFAQMIADQVYGKNSFKGKDFTFGGQNRYQIVQNDEKPNLDERGRIALAQILGIAAPYRIADKIANPGVQGDDSLLFSPRPTQYKKSDIVANIKDSVEEEKKRGVARKVLEGTVPFIPQPDRTSKTLTKKKAKLKKKKSGNIYDQAYSTPRSESEDRLSKIYSKVYQ